MGDLEGSARGTEGPMNTLLHTLYKEKIIAWRDLAVRWDRQECECQELMEARGAMEILATLVTGEAKPEK